MLFISVPNGKFFRTGESTVTLPCFHQVPEVPIATSLPNIEPTIVMQSTDHSTARFRHHFAGKHNHQ